MQKSIRFATKALCAIVISVIVFGILPQTVLANDYPAYQKKNLYETETVKISEIPIYTYIGDWEEPYPIEKDVKFKLLNCTTQTFEPDVIAKNGKLPELNLIKDHNYVFIAEDAEYKMNPLYVWIKEDGMYDVKKDFRIDEDGKVTNKNDKVTEITLDERAKDSPGAKDPENDNRKLVNIPVIKYKGRMANVKVKFVSPYDVVEDVSDNNGEFRKAKLLEDITYMVVIDSEEYASETNVITVKDKTEWSDQKGIYSRCYFFDHRSCAYVDSIKLIDKVKEHEDDTVKTSESKDATVTGMNFKDSLFNDRKLEGYQIPALQGKDCEVYQFDLINTHRWERLRLVAGEYTLTKKLPEGKSLEKLSYVDADGQLKPLEFTQENGAVTFKMDSLSMYPVVFEYGNVSEKEQREDKKIQVQTLKLRGDSNKIAAGKTIRLIAEITPSQASNKKMNWISSNTKYATVDNNGKVSVKKTGAGKNVKITAKALDGSGKTAEYSIKIMKDAVKSISLKAKKNAKVGSKLSIKAKVKTTGKNANKSLMWSSSNVKYATVNGKGKVSLKKAGKGKTVKITARALDGSGKKKTIAIKIQ